MKEDGAKYNRRTGIQDVDGPKWNSSSRILFRSNLRDLETSGKTEEQDRERTAAGRTLALEQMFRSPTPRVGVGGTG